MQGCARFSRLPVIVAMGGVLACADGLAPNRSPDVVPQPGGIAAKDSTPSLASDTTIPANRLRGMVVGTSLDSTTTWRPMESVRIEAAQRDTRTGAMIVLAVTSSDDAGRFVFGTIDVPTGLLFVRAVPASATGYRASRWLAAYAFVGSWLTVGKGGPQVPPTDVWKLGPYLIVERADAPERDHAPVLLIGRVVGVEGTQPDIPVAGARLVIDRGIPGSGDDPPTSGGTVASGRTDANGFVLIALSDPGLYISRVTMPVESPYRDVPGGPSFTAVVDAEASRVVYSHYSVGRR